MTDEERSPATTPSADPGDDTQRRFRYPASCTARAALSLLEEDSEIEEIYCEQHEDILIRRKDGKFIGRQVKTREPHLGPFKASDEAMKKTLTRFVMLERDFPGKFAIFAIATNTAFFRKDNDAGDLRYVCNIARTAVRDAPKRLPKALKGFLDDIMETTGCGKETVLSALSKVELNGPLHAIDDGEGRVLARLNGIPSLEGCRYEDAIRISRALVEMAARAASLANDSPARDYFDVLDGGASALVQERIEGKRLTKATVQAVIASTLSGELTLVTTDTTTIQTLPKGVRKLEVKMGRGGLSLSNISLAKDLKASTDLLLQRWYHRFGAERAEKMYQHLRTLVFVACQTAHDSTLVDGETFGFRMLVAVRAALKDKRAADGVLPSQCTEDHFFGMAAILTEDCKVWWSETFELPPEADG